MSNKIIQHKRSSTSGNVPAAGVLSPGEIGINFADRSIFTEDGGGSVIELVRDIYKQAAAPSAPIVGDGWYNTTKQELRFWDGSNWIYATFTGLDVLAANTSSANGFASGAGTSGSPYIANATVSYPGETNHIDIITVTDLNSGQAVSINDENSAANGGRFAFLNNVADSDGVANIIVVIADFPESSVGTTYTANIKIGNNTVYFNLTNTIQSRADPLQTINSPVNTNSVSTSWSDADDTLTSTGCLLISKDDVTFDQGPLTILNGETLYTKWDGAPGSDSCIDDAHGTVINGDVVNSAGSSNSHTLTVDKEPSAFNFTDATGVATSSKSTSNTVDITDINSYAYITGTETGGTNPEFTVNGGTYVAVPGSQDNALYAVDGDTITVRHTNSGTTSTASDLLLNVGSTSDTYTSTTSAAVPAVVTPTITAPTDGASSISTNPTFTSSAYATSGGAGTHQDTDWEVYSDAGLSTLVASSMADTTNLESWSPPSCTLSGNTTYYVRVRHRSNDPVDSAWSNANSFTTGAEAGTTWTQHTTGTPTFRDIAFDGNEYIAIGTGATSLGRSTDGVTWTTEVAPVPASGKLLSISPDGAVVVGDDVHNVSNGLLVASPGEALTDITNIGAGSYAACAEAGKVLVATSGAAGPWSTIGTVSGAADLNRVFYSATAGMLVAVGDGGAIGTSTDLTTLQTRTSGTGNNLWGIVYDNSQWVVVGRSGTILTSPDGITWTTRTSGTTNELRNIIWDGCKYIAVARGGDIITSPDGITWSAAHLASGDVYSIIFNSPQYVAVGQVVLTSS